MLLNSIIDDETLLEILHLPILVILDEAYVEFSGMESKMKWVKKHENLIVLRTFSKRAGRFILFHLTSMRECNMYAWKNRLPLVALLLI